MRLSAIQFSRSADIVDVADVVFAGVVVVHCDRCVFQMMGFRQADHTPSGCVRICQEVKIIATRWMLVCRQREVGYILYRSRRFQ
jgi:hypothetical protein